MESIVFANSPLAEYLEGSGENEADWGIEPAVSDTEHHQIFAPSGVSSVKPRFKKEQLKLSHAGGNSGRTKFYELFSKAVDSRLSRRENSRFLERFRYVIVASQLLNGHVNVSHYDRKPDDDRVAQGEDQSSLFGQVVTKQTRYWIGGGGFVLVTSVMLSWVFRGSAGRFSKARALAVVVLVLVAAVIIVGHFRRKWLRSLRGKAIEFAAVFVQNSQSFDILASSAVTLIQEVELVSRGYRLSAPLPPISRLERDTQTRRCARLRKAVYEALAEAIPPHNQACNSLRHLVEEEDLERYFDIYDIQIADLEEVELGFSEEEFDDMESLKVLKALLHRLHTIRRVFLCSLMAVDTQGSYAEYQKWGLVVEQLRSIGNLIAELASKLKKIQGEEEQFSVPPTPKSPLSPENEKYRGQLRKFNSLSQALRGLQAKMHVLREESDRTLEESSDLSDFSRELLIHYDSIGADLRALVDEWENARSSLLTTVDRRDRASSTSPKSIKSPESISGSTLAGTPRNSGLFTKIDGSWADAAGLGLLSPTKDSHEQDQASDEEIVYEAVADPRPRSTLTREERIRKVQEERARAAEKRKSAEAGLALQRELQSVLINRPPPKRRADRKRNFST